VLAAAATGGAVRFTPMAEGSGAGFRPPRSGAVELGDHLGSEQEDDHRHFRC